jgi:hypothetical protein
MNVGEVKRHPAENHHEQHGEPIHWMLYESPIDDLHKALPFYDAAGAATGARLV